RHLHSFPTRRSSDLVVDAKRDSQEGDFAAHERSEPAFRSRARRSETWSGFITEWWWDGSSYVIDFTVGWSFGDATAIYVILSIGSGPGGRWFKSIRPTTSLRM